MSKLQIESKQKQQKTQFMNKLLLYFLNLLFSMFNYILENLSKSIL